MANRIPGSYRRWRRASGATQPVAALLVLASVGVTGAAEVTPVGPEFRVSRIGDTYKNSSDGRPRDPRVVRTSDDGFVVAWEAYSYKYGYYYSQTGAGVFVRRFDAAGNPKAKEFPVYFSEAYPARFRPNLAIDTQDRFVVVWGDYDQDASFGKVFARRYNPAGNPMGSAFQVNPTLTANTNGQADIGVAATAGDGFAVVWQELDGGDPNPDIIGRRFDGNAAPLGPEFQTNTVPMNPCCNGYPNIAADAAGRFTVVWQDTSATRDGVFGQRFAADGTPLGGEFEVFQGATSEGPVRVRANAAGDVFVLGFVDGETLVRAFDPSGAPHGPGFRLPSVDSGRADYADAGPDADGKFVVAWFDTFNYAFRGQRYAPDGTADGGPFTIAEETPERLVYNPPLATPVIAADSHGDFVVVWGNDYYVYPDDDQEGPYEAPGVWGRLFAVCGNGRIGRNQTCDDGNAVTGDGCSARCDLETCFHCSGEPSACVAVPGCASTCVDGVAIADSAVLTFGGLTRGAGRHSIAFRGTVPAPPFPSLGFDPSADGLEVAVTSGPNLVHQIVAPAGLAGTSPCHPKDGWKRRGSSPSWTYKNVSGALPPACTPGSAGGLRTLKFADQIATGRGYQFDVKVKNTTVATNPPVPPVLATLVLGRSPGAGLAGECARIPFTRSIGTRFYP